LWESPEWRNFADSDEEVVMFAFLKKTVVSGMILAGVAAPALAETTSTTLFQHKHWEVELVSYDDGTYACLAEVDAGSDSFTLWTYGDSSVRLQFYSLDWDFGDNGETADLSVEIDRRGAWSLTAADLYMNSVLFNLPDSDLSVDFIVEVANGNTLHLRTDTGEGVKDYSLAGSSASIGALIDCNETLAGGSNPFN
jgi:hypothetical protein